MRVLRKLWREETHLHSSRWGFREWIGIQSMVTHDILNSRFPTFHWSCSHFKILPCFRDTTLWFAHPPQVKRGIDLVYGGGSIGLMGTVAQAVQDAGGHVIGYTFCCNVSACRFLFYRTALVCAAFETLDLSRQKGQTSIEWIIIEPKYSNVFVTWWTIHSLKVWLYSFPLSLIFTRASMFLRRERVHCAVTYS